MQLNHSDGQEDDGEGDEAHGEGRKLFSSHRF